MKYNFKLLLSACASLLMAGNICAQDIKVDRSKYPDATPHASGPTKSMVASQPQPTNAARSSIYGDTRPDHVNNALRKFYPPVFNQDGGSCGSAQAVGYCMTYEMNAYRNADASYTDNQLPTHFTWLHTYAGIEKYPIMNKHGVPSVTDYGGRTYSDLFGNQDTSSPHYGYMQGYDKWYRAMFNRTIGGDTFCDGNQMTEIGREQLKQWLWNHWGDESFYGGGVSGIGVASGGIWGKIPNTATNREIGVAGLYCVSSWGKTYDHALSIVGYDDRIEFDLDSNGVYGEPGKDETGAWIICNSWGAGWCNKGFIYCPYKFSYAIGTSTLPLNSGHYTWRKDHEPKRVFKILMDYSHRSEISLSVGVAADTSATKPEATDVMPFFNYAGDGTKSNPAPAVPMLGKWRTKFNYEPMEFGYDLTDLTEGYDPSQPLKYFLIVDSKSGAIGAGNIYKLSLMDYTIEENGLELPARIDTVAVLNNGRSTMVSITVPGRQTYAPLNASLSDTRLTWSEPKASSFRIARYYIYKGAQKVAEVPSMSHSYIVDDPQATYYVATAYAYKNQILLSPKSEPARRASTMPKAETNKTLVLNKTSVVVPNIFKEPTKQATIEFWMKPNSVSSFNQQIGQQWGTFLFSTSATGQIYCGWDTNNRVITSANTLKVGNWYHVALVVDGNTITVYVNGMKKGSCTSESYSGIPALNMFRIGTPDGTCDAEIDEFRIWTTARTQKELFTNKGLPVACPSAQTDIIVYYPMDTYESLGTLYLKDYASSNDAELYNTQLSENNTILSGTSAAPNASFTATATTIYAGEPVQLRAASTVNAVSWQWAAPDAATPQSTVINPYFTFAKAGEFPVTLTITDADGLVTDSTLTLTVVSPDAPKADFDIAASTLNEGEMFCFANKSTGANCVYTWSLPGADTEVMNSVNAGVIYNQTGTFPVTLTATNAGGTDQITKYVTVQHSVPSVAFSVDPSLITLGETTYLVDESRHNPTQWQWTITNNIHTTIIQGQNSSFTPAHPGVYNITLDATNDIGTATHVEPRKLIVTNADSHNGLNFTGSETAVSTASPFAEGNKAFTIEWWMNPAKTEGALNISTANNQFATTTDIDGNMSVFIQGKSVNSGREYVIPGEWHHYAISYSFGTVKFYRDAVLITQPTTRLATSTTDWGLLTIGGGEDSFAGQLDELRIWSKALSLSVMKGYINAPLAAPADLTASAGLVAYYDFNQNGGSVLDRSSNHIDLTRQGFGPDGDAWGLSRGVFTLDLDPASPTDTLQADGLTHVYQSVAAGKTTKYLGLRGFIRLAIEGNEQVRIFTLGGQCVMNDTVEGVHYLPFEPGVYLVNGEKVIVQ